MKFNIESYRRIQLFFAEWFDAWRVFPRIMVGLYMLMVYEVVRWYMALEDHIMPGCIVKSGITCIIEAPSNQHAVLVTAVIGFSAAIFGFYTSTSKKHVVPPKEKDKPHAKYKESDNY